MKRFIILLPLVLIFTGAICDNEPEPDDYIQAGWEDFEAGNIEDARGNFDSALDSTTTRAEAYNGLGWCDLLEGDLTNALGNFENALSLENLLDANAGASLAAADAGEHEKAVDYADVVIGADGSYVFSHYTSVTIEDIRLVKARASAWLGNFNAALDEVNWFLPEFEADPETPEGQASILAQIEVLLDQYGS